MGRKSQKLNLKLRKISFQRFNYKGKVFAEHRIATCGTIRFPRNTIQNHLNYGKAKVTFYDYLISPFEG